MPRETVKGSERVFAIEADTYLQAVGWKNIIRCVGGTGPAGSGTGKWCSQCKFTAILLIELVLILFLLLERRYQY